VIRLEDGIAGHVTLPLLGQRMGRSIIGLSGIGDGAVVSDQDVYFLRSAIMPPENIIEDLSGLIPEIGRHEKLHLAHIAGAFLDTQDVRSQVPNDLSHAPAQSIHIGYRILWIASRLIPLPESDTALADEPIVHPLNVPTYDFHCRPPPYVF
jgi:hypothetical protein